MEWQMADIIQSIGIIVTLLIAIWQMRVQDRHVQAAIDLSLNEKFDRGNQLWFDHPDLFSLLDEEYVEPPPDDARRRLETVMFMVFNTFELAFRHQRHYGIREEVWCDWEQLMDLYLEKKYFPGWWHQRAGHEYNREFGAYVRERMTLLELSAATANGHSA